MTQNQQQNGHHPTKICVAVDDTPQAADTLRWAANNLARPEDEVHLVHVVRPSVSAEFMADVPTTPWADPTPDDLKSADTLLDKCSKIAKEAGLEHVKTKKIVGADGAFDGVGCSIKNFAEQQHMDTLVLGSPASEMGPLSKMVFGMLGMAGIRNWCTKNVPCDVVVCKPHPHEQKAE